METDTINIAIPKELENMRLPSPQMAEYWKLAENRIFFIDYKEIESEDLLEIEKSIININIVDKGKKVEERKPIILSIYTYGGDLNAAYSLIDICLSSTTPVYTVNMGLSLSAGLLLLLAGTKRFALNHSQSLIHTGSGILGGTYEQIEESQKSYKNQIEQMKDYILNRTKIDIKLFNKNKTKDWYINGEEQVELGIVDKIITNLDEVF